MLGGSGFGSSVWLKKDEVSWFGCIPATVSLQNTINIIKYTWTFYAAFDSATVKETYQFGACIWFTVDTMVHCFWIFMLTLYGSHNGDLVFKIFKDAMDNIFSGLEHTLFLKWLDRVYNIPGRVFGIVYLIFTLFNYFQSEFDPIMVHF